MARSSMSTLRGLATYSDKLARAGCSGCSGCSIMLVVMLVVYVIGRYWVPILILVGGVVALAVLRGLVARKKANARSLPVAPSEPDSRAQDAAQCPSGWYADPAGQHQCRYWDGGGWSDAVADNGVVSTHWPWASRSE